MAKKVIICLVLAMLIAGGVFAEETAESSAENPAKGFTHWVSGEVSLLGGGARYEMMLSPVLSVGANIYFSSFFLLWNEFGIDVNARYYLKGNFFVGAGLGYHAHTNLQTMPKNVFDSNSDAAIKGVALTPEVGWKFDVGNPGGFYISPGIKFPLTFGSREVPYAVIDETSGNIKYKFENEFSVGFGIVPYFGMGFAF